MHPPHGVPSRIHRMESQVASDKYVVTCHRLGHGNTDEQSLPQVVEELREAAICGIAAVGSTRRDLAPRSRASAKDTGALLTVAPAAILGAKMIIWIYEHI